MQQSTNISSTYSEYCTGYYGFGFNGKEKDDEVKGTGNSLDFGARIYDSRTGRWLSVDLLSGKYAGFSPFNFVRNSPMINIDPDGEDTYLVIYGAGADNPVLKTHNQGDNFKQSALALQKRLHKSGVLKEGDEVVVVYATTESEFINAVNKKYESGKIAQLDVFSHGSNNSMNFGGNENMEDGYTDAQKDYRLVSYFGSSVNPDGNNEFEQVDADNFTENAKVNLWGCNLGGSTTDPDEKCNAQGFADQLGGEREIKAFKNSGAEFKSKDNGKTAIIDGTMIRSKDRKSQEVKQTTFKKKN